MNSAEMIANSIYEKLSDFDGEEAGDVLTGLSAVLSAVAVQMGVPEEDAMESFQKSFRAAKLKLSSGEIH
jgi:hypothetical protein